jgi:hypothetical protein
MANSCEGVGRGACSAYSMKVLPTVVRTWSPDDSLGSECLYGPLARARMQRNATQCLDDDVMTTPVLYGYCAYKAAHRVPVLRQVPYLLVLYSMWSLDIQRHIYPARLVPCSYPSGRPW